MPRAQRRPINDKKQNETGREKRRKHKTRVSPDAVFFIEDLIENLPRQVIRTDDDSDQFFTNEFFNGFLFK